MPRSSLAPPALSASLPLHSHNSCRTNVPLLHTYLRIHNQADSIITLLTDDYVLSRNVNQRKGGLTSLAAAAVGLGPRLTHYLFQFVAAIMACFDDSDRY